MSGILFRPPAVVDGVALSRLVQRCQPLDTNSVYVYLLLGCHFRDTCVVAERDQEVVGFVSAYIPPRQREALFVWQVAVDAVARGQGLAGRMLDELLGRPACAEVSYLETTVTPSNEPSRRLFQALARRLGTECRTSVLFPSELFSGADSEESADAGAPPHEAEELLRIGPFSWSCTQVYSHSGGEPQA